MDWVSFLLGIMAGAFLQMALTLAINILIWGADV